ncbi:MAG: arginine biosynthesis protein ArgJ, partial [Ruminococcus sp.]|nr:arginine biosynthesis protein ArgJ [Ruminococcus sp.]
MNLKEVKGVTFIDGGVCASKGFKANGIHCGLAHKPLTDTEANSAIANNALPTKKKNDLALIVADKECTASAVYTTNKVKGAP